MSGFELKNGKYIIDKDPNANLDYSEDWTDWLGTDTIVSAQWTKTGAVTLGNTQVDPTGKICTAWVSGGTAGETCSITCRITTAAGRIDDRTVYLKIKER